MKTPLLPALALLLLSQAAVAKVQWHEPKVQHMDTAEEAFRIMRISEYGYATADTAVVLDPGNEYVDWTRGEWYFRGGDFRHAPISFLRLWSEKGSPDVHATFVCDGSEKACADLRARARSEAEKRAALGPMRMREPPPRTGPPQPPRPGNVYLDFDEHTEPKCFRCPPPTYPPTEKASSETGELTLRLTYSADGAVTDVKVVRSSGNPVFEIAAVAAARTWWLTPGTRNGKPEAGELEVPMVFKLDEAPTPAK